MAAGRYDFTGDARLEQGSAMTRDFIYRDSNGALVDLTGYDGVMQVRQNIRSSTVLLELSVDNGGIVFDGPAGKMTMVLSKAVADTMDFLSGVHGIELTPPSGQTFRFLEGEVEVSPDPVRSS